MAGSLHVIIRAVHFTTPPPPPQSPLSPPHSLMLLLFSLLSTWTAHKLVKRLAKHICNATQTEHIDCAGPRAQAWSVGVQCAQLCSVCDRVAASPAHMRVQCAPLHGLRLSHSITVAVARFSLAHFFTHFHTPFLFYGHYTRARRLASHLSLRDLVRRQFVHIPRAFMLLCCPYYDARSHCICR